MNVETKIQTGQTASMDIATIVAQTPVVVLIDADKRKGLYEHIQREIDAFEPDVTTNKGREAIKSLAYKITRTKTAIDGAGKTLNEEARAKINVVDEARRDARSTLDAMAEKVRQPLTDWEAAEKERVDQCNEMIARIKRAAMVTLDDTADSVRARGQTIYETKEVITEGFYGDLYETAMQERSDTIGTLKMALVRLEKEEADRAELERLRAENEARAAREREEAEARARQEREAEEARQAEERRIAAEQAAKERDERIAREATERAQREAEERHAAELQAERDRVAAIDLERESQIREMKRQEEEREQQAARVRAEQERQAEEDRKREANKTHQKRVMGAAKVAIMGVGASEQIAIAIVKAIVAGDVPNTKIVF